MTLTIKIATATTSREIFLVNDYDGVFKDKVEAQRFSPRWWRRTIYIVPPYDARLRRSRFLLT